MTAQAASDAKRKSEGVRDVAPDVLRGFALMGILIVNIPFMALSSAEGATGEFVSGFANGTAAFLMSALFLGKFYLIFSFLFGYSSHYIVRDQRSNVWRWVRRCIALIVLGALHFTFLWHGDILFLYGVFGLLLVPFFFRRDRTLTIWSRVVYISFSAILLVIGAFAVLFEALFPTALDNAGFVSPLDAVMTNGTFVEAIGPRVDLWVIGILGTGLVLQGGFAFAAFLIGMRLARSRFLSGNLQPSVTSRMVAIGLGIGLPIQVAFATVAVLNEQADTPSGAILVVSSSMLFIAAPLLTMGYIGVILKVLGKRPGTVLWMAPAGRMSLTVYIAESILAALVFAPWGLGLFQRVDLWLVLLIGLLIWLVLVGFATVFFRRFSQGPLEWLVHVTTRRRQNLEKARA